MNISPKHIFLFLTIATALIFSWPSIQFQPLLSQGDHGRDLYAFDQVTQGQLPYKDFWWVYGPLMPYYYGLCFKILGVHIGSALIGQAMLAIACAVVFYLCAALLMAPGLAYLGAVWFLQTRQEFFFTFNHTGGILAELIIAFCLLSYLHKGLIKYLWGAALTTLLLMLIKINFGLAGWAGTIAAVLLIDAVKQIPLTDEKKKFYAVILVTIPGVAGLIYWLLLKDLPLYAIRQCMPYFGDDQPYHASPLLVIPYYLTQHWLTFKHTWVNMLIGLIFHGATLGAIYALFTGKIERTQRQHTVLALAITGLFFGLYLHEFLVSAVWYRNYWAFPFLMLFHFIMLSIIFPLIPKILKALILAYFIGLIAIGLVSHIPATQTQKIPPRFLNAPRGQIYVGNELPWTDTVNRVSAYLMATLKPGEQFLALPYDNLYYFLTGTQSPTRQLIFFDHIKIPPQQEIAIIQDIEQNNVRYVLMSNRVISNETGLGVFGKTYSVLLSKYIATNFTPVLRQGGDWQQPPGWGHNHGVIIFKRK